MEPKMYPLDLPSPEVLSQYAEENNYDNTIEGTDGITDAERHWIADRYRERMNTPVDKEKVLAFLRTLRSN